MRPKRLLDRAHDELNLDVETRAALDALAEEWDRGNAERMAEMASALNRQAAQIERMQTTLQVLVEALRPNLQPEIVGALPVAFRVAGSDDDPDVATAQVVADPIALGFTLSQANIAEIAGLPASTTSKLVKVFRMDEDPTCAVVVRRGKGRTIVNYKPVAAKVLIDKIRATPESDVPKDARSALRSAKILSGS